MNGKKKIIIFSIILLMVVISMIVGVTYALLSYTKEGLKNNSINPSSVEFRYAEGTTNEISIGDGLPMLENEGKAQINYFEFTVTSKTSSTLSIPYEITSRKNDPNNVSAAIRVYLTEVVNNQEVELLYEFYNELIDINHNNNVEQILHLDSVPINTINYNHVYRLRIWMDNDKYWEQEEDNEGNTIYPYNGKTFSMTVNVYATGNVGSSRTYESEARLSSLGITGYNIKTDNNENFSSSETNYYLTVADNVTSITVTGVPLSNKATVIGLGEKQLNHGMNVITVKVTADNQTTNKYYTINVLRSD